MHDSAREMLPEVGRSRVRACVGASDGLWKILSMCKCHYFEPEEISQKLLEDSVPNLFSEMGAGQ